MAKRSLSDIPGGKPLLAILDRVQRDGVQRWKDVEGEFVAAMW